METHETIIRICCLCHKIKSADGWVKHEGEGASHLSHGYCPKCYAKVIKRINKRRGVGQ